jgi:starch phosphorylase
MAAPESRADSPGAFLFSAQVSAVRPASDYTVRIIAHHPNASVPLEAGQILWQR